MLKFQFVALVSREENRTYRLQRRQLHSDTKI